MNLRKILTPKTPYGIFAYGSFGAVITYELSKFIHSLIPHHHFIGFGIAVGLWIAMYSIADRMIKKRWILAKSDNIQN